MSLTKVELINKLKEISSLYNNVIEIKGEMNNFEPEDNYKREIEVPKFPFEIKNEYDEKVFEVLNNIGHTDDDALEFMSKCYDTAYHPKKPADFKKPTYNGADTSVCLEKQSKYKLISNLGLGVAIFFILGALVGTSDTPEALPTILVIALLGAIAFVVGRLLLNKQKDVENKLESEAKATYDKEVARLQQKYDNAVALYEEECNSYISVRESFLKNYAKWRKIYIESVSEKSEIKNKLEADRQAGVNEIKESKFRPALDALNSYNDLVTVEYLPVIDTIIDLLESGRADDLKEAINLYEEIEYRERQLRLEKEKEAQRRYEEKMRRADAERHHREDMAQRESEERERRREEERRRDDEERRHREDMAQREKMERDRRYEEERQKQEQRRKDEREKAERERQERNATSHQCNTCALCSRCSMSFRRPNCASYKPR